MFKTKHLKWVICECCQGNGRVEHPAFSNGFTGQEWDDMKSDWDDRDDSNGVDRYMRGDYDVPCGECKASGKMRVPDVGAMSFAEKRAYVTWQRQEAEDARDLADMRAEEAAERAMGC